MTIGGGIALIAIGAILAFAVQIEPQAIDLTMIGYILMIAGAVGLVFGVVMWGNRRTRAVRREPGGRVVEERIEDRQM
jgi:phosphate/sulfate permease